MMLTWLSSACILHADLTRENKGTMTAMREGTCADSWPDFKPRFQTFVRKNPKSKRRKKLSCLVNRQSAIGREHAEPAVEFAKNQFESTL